MGGGHNVRVHCKVCYELAVAFELRPSIIIHVA